MDNHIKNRIHNIVNHLQAIMGYIELEQYDKAIAETKTTANEVITLQRDLESVIVVTTKTETVVVIPTPVTVVPADEVKHKLTPSDQAAVDAASIAIVHKKKKKNDGPKLIRPRVH